MQYNQPMRSNTRKTIQLTALALLLGIMPAALALADQVNGAYLANPTPAPTAHNYVIFDPVQLPAHGQVPVWCPAGHVPQLVLRQDRPSRKGFVQCVALAAAATPLPPLQSPIGSPTPELGVAPLPTMPSYTK